MTDIHAERDAPALSVGVKFIFTRWGRGDAPALSVGVKFIFTRWGRGVAGP